MRIICKAHIYNKTERQNLVDKLKQWADCIEVNNAVFASYCGEDKRLADSIIAMMEVYQDYEIHTSDN